MKTKVVRKYLLNQKVPIPRGAEILHIDYQDGQIQIWALVDPNEPIIEQRTFFIVGTGSLLPDTPTPLTHLTTLKSGPFIWHIFEQTTNEKNN